MHSLFDVDTKSLRRLLNQRFDREASIWSKLQKCPYIVPFIGITRDGDSLYMVSPWMERGNIVSYIKLNPDAPILLLVSSIAIPVCFLCDL